MDRLPISGNVPADVAERMSDRREFPGLPDLTDRDLLRAIVSEELVEPLGHLIEAMQPNVHPDELKRAAAQVERALLLLCNEL
jgi:hypothetical protein